MNLSYGFLKRVKRQWPFNPCSDWEVRRRGRVDVISSVYGDGQLPPFIRELKLAAEEDIEKLICKFRKILYKKEIRIQELKNKSDKIKSTVDCQEATYDLSSSSLISSNLVSVINKIRIYVIFNIVLFIVLFIANFRLVQGNIGDSTVGIFLGLINSSFVFLISHLLGKIFQFEDLKKKIGSMYALIGGVLLIGLLGLGIILNSLNLIYINTNIIVFLFVTVYSIQIYDNTFLKSYGQEVSIRKITKRIKKLNKYINKLQKRIISSDICKYNLFHRYDQRIKAIRLEFTRLVMMYQYSTALTSENAESNKNSYEVTLAYHFDISNFMEYKNSNIEVEV